MSGIMENWQKLTGKTKKMIIAIVAGTAAIAIIGVLGLNLGKSSDYSTLFTGLNQDETQTVVNILQEEGVDYKFSVNDGTIRVPSKEVDQTRASLLSQGYPKSGFAYDMYRDNAGLMTTESDKKQYTLYELQDRLGAQISLFEGVQEARVTIAEAKDQRYALEDRSQTDASASVVVIMKNGQQLSENKAAAIKNLIARSVRGMNFTNVAVFDAVAMEEVGGSGDGEEGMGSARDMTALTSMIEENIAKKVRLVLEELYGSDQVAVSVKGTLNMERLIQENTLYSTPEKADEQDKTGLLEKEETTSENSAVKNQESGGVAGAQANTDTPRYTNNNGNREESDHYENGSAARQWLYNMVKEQRQVDPGVLENITIGVVISTENTAVPQEDIINLIANSAGIPKVDAPDKITVIRALAQNMAEDGAEEVSTKPKEGKADVMVPAVIGAVAAAVLLMLVIILLVRRQGRREQFQQEELDQAELELPVKASKAGSIPADIVDEEMERNEEILNLRMQHSLKLKQNIGEFVDQNPQIAAKLLQSWLRGEGVKDGGNRSSDITRQRT